MRFIPGGFGFVGQFLGTLIAGMFFVVVVIVAVGVLFVLVRFLIAATRAADTYVRVHAVPKDEAAVANVAPVTPPVTPPVAPRGTPAPAPAGAPSTTKAVPTTPLPTTAAPTTARPATKPRTPKTPPAN
jgi:hypothetical protein